MQGSKIASTLMVILLLVCTHACYEPIEGCLDIQATNFAFGADRSVDSLCQYPVIEYTFSPVYGDSLLISTSRYTNRLGQEFSLNTYNFLISNVSLTNVKGEAIRSRNTFEAIVGQEGSTSLISLPQDIVEVGRFDIIASIGNVREVGDFTGIAFDVGVPAQIHEVNAVSYADDENYLHTIADQYTANQGLSWSNWVVYHYTDEDEIDTLSITLNKNHPAFTYSLDTVFVKNNGINAEFEIEIDFQKWLSGVDFENMDSLEIATKCHQNIPISFSLK